MWYLMIPTANQNWQVVRVGPLVVDEHVSWSILEEEALKLLDKWQSKKTAKINALTLIDL